MFELTKDQLFQWDSDIKLLVTDKTVTQVHFTNGLGECALVVDVQEEGSARFVFIPNILLQESWNIRAYAFCSHCTMVERIFEVISRKKPTDYVYTETEIASFERLEERINEVAESVTVEGVSKAVEQYLQENPIEGGATEAELEQIAANTEAIGQLEAALEDIVVPDMGDYYTKQETNDLIAEIDIPETDLSNYYTKQQTDSAISAAKPDLAPYALKTEIPTVPDMGNYYNKQEVDNKIANIPTGGGSSGSVEEIYIGTEAPEDPEVKMWIDPSAESINFATEAYVDAALESIVIPDTSNFIVMSDVQALGYQTQAQVETIVNNAVAAITDGEAKSY